MNQTRKKALCDCKSYGCSNFCQCPCHKDEFEIFDPTIEEKFNNIFDKVSRNERIALFDVAILGLATDGFIKLIQFLRKNGYNRECNSDYFVISL